jgi:biotin transporter BioY
MFIGVKKMNKYLPVVFAFFAGIEIMLAIWKINNGMDGIAFTIFLAAFFLVGAITGAQRQRW